MTLRSIRLADIAPQPWRNGGGQTRELLCWPGAADWSLRVSVAHIDADGPFSAFAGVERWLALIDGAGVQLAFGDEARSLMPGSEPLRFDGAAAPHCRLVNGPTRDLNLMLRNGQGVMQTAEAGIGFDAPFAMRGLFTATAGRWSCEGALIVLPANTLLWSDSAHSAAWVFEPDALPPQAWWLGFTPKDSHS